MSAASAVPERRRALLGLGTNLGNREENLRRGLERLAEHEAISVLARSSLYESEPVGFVDQPLFLNLVAGIETALSPDALLDVILEIEKELGRVRTFPNAPRTLDIDILFYAGETVRTDRLTLPHPRYAERAFVVVPMEEILTQPPLQHPEWDDLRAALKTNRAREGVRQWKPDL